MPRALIGTVTPHGAACSFPCRLDHLSSFGARLTLLVPVRVEGDVVLSLGVGERPREARVVHRDGLTVLAELRPARKAPAKRSRPAA